ncbi:MAG: sulfite oxidase-like oxidoreductase [Chloroflexota bacterium]|nr:sulfite oxidase-like oxidoreductase [Chloroflexota bacterium]
MNGGIVKSPDTQRENRVPPGQRAIERWPVLHYGAVPRVDTAGWSFTISGLVAKERKLSYQEFMALPRVKVFADIHCVTGWSRLNNLWEGISTAAIRELASVLPGAKYVIVHGVGGFTTNLSLSDFFESDVLFGLKHDGESISPEHGAPVRLVVPRLYFWKSAKWVVGIEFTEKDKPGFWESHGYHNHGDPWLEERYG